MFHRYTLLYIAIALLLLAGCSSGGDEPAPGVIDGAKEISMLVSLPKPVGSRAVQDPGSAVDESVDWNCLVIWLIYFEDSEGKPTDGIIRSEWTKEQYDKLPYYNENTGIKRLTILATPGKAYVYGVAYYYDSSDPTGTRSEKLRANINACSKLADIQALTIENNIYYNSATGDNISRVVSVATGFYRNGDITPAELDITQAIINGYGGGSNTAGTAMPSIPVITLSRLATLVDIQWEVAETYTVKDVRLTDFTFHGAGSFKGTTTGDGAITSYETGAGHLFPELYTSTSTSISGSKLFYNTSEISQRNGRVYHYVYPDGIGKPSIDLKMKANEVDADGNTTTTEQSHSIQFDAPLKPATWYKVNVSIKGNNATGAITVNNAASGN